MIRRTVATAALTAVTALALAGPAAAVSRHAADPIGGLVGMLGGQDGVGMLSGLLSQGGDSGALAGGLAGVTGGLAG